MTTYTTGTITHAHLTERQLAITVQWLTGHVITYTSHGRADIIARSLDITNSRELIGQTRHGIVESRHGFDVLLAAREA